ncbi:GNAT family N-acetyltransferase [Bauldia sp.]|uniref:GNAT family N-acetyltransferase n=1 Tax=Bauldia sp. TaxID=2575872 RepID=UPI003BAC7269
MTDSADVVIRPAMVADHAALKRICVQTANNGDDATEREDAPDLVGLIYAVPYQVFAPDFAFMAEDATGPCGYVLGAPDTLAFEAWLESEWFPPLRERLIDPGPDENAWRGSDWARRFIHHPHYTDLTSLDRYPACGHIDLLPRARGKGLGRRCMRLFMDKLAEAGVPGLHLDVGPTNLDAQQFYKAVGFRFADDRDLKGSQTYMIRELP